VTKLSSDGAALSPTHCFISGGLNFPIELADALSLRLKSHARLEAEDLVRGRYWQRKEEFSTSIAPINGFCAKKKDSSNRQDHERDPYLGVNCAISEAIESTALSSTVIDGSGLWFAVPRRWSGGDSNRRSHPSKSIVYCRFGTDLFATANIVV
jgi:hypothetical protein